jgi:cell division protease FtsH
MKTKGCKDIFDALTKDHYTFIIGNDQILQNKLESAVSEGKLQDFNFLSKAIGLISSSVYCR